MEDDTLIYEIQEGIWGGDCKIGMQYVLYQYSNSDSRVHLILKFI